MNYAKHIVADFRKKKIHEGDTIQVGDKSGILMPLPKIAADPNLIILKLDNGYNVGVPYEKALKKIEPAPPTRKERTGAMFVGDKSKPTVSILSTGGTISSKIDYRTGGVYARFSAQDMVESVPELVNTASIKARMIMQVMSEDMDHTHWRTMAKEAAKELNSKDVSGVIITHGTDMMHYSSAALSFMLCNLNKPVVFTGAQRSSDRGSADTSMNMLCSVITAARSPFAEVGICMHGTTEDNYCLFTRGTKVRKMHTSRRDAFQPINDAPLARVFQGGNIEVTNDNYTKRNNSRVNVCAKFEPRVAMLKVYPGAQPDILESLIKNGYRGIILEGTGLGHVPTQCKNSWINPIKRATERGIFIGVAPQTIYGRLSSDVYTNLRILYYDAGAVCLNDMLPETAYVKLGWVLGHTRNMNKAKEMMLSNIANEMNPRTI